MHRMGRSIQLINTSGCLLLLGVLFPIIGFSQSVAAEKGIKIVPTLGLSFRTTPAIWGSEERDFGEPFSPVPYDAEPNLQGLSFNPGVQINVRQFGFEYSPSLRYDQVRGSDRIIRHGMDNAVTSPVESFIVDHNFSLYLQHKVKLGAGISFVNANENFEYFDSNEGSQEIQQISFTAYSLFITVPIKKHIQLELKPQYVNSGLASDPDAHAMMFAIRVYYQFSSLF